MNDDGSAPSEDWKNPDEHKRPVGYEELEELPAFEPVENRTDPPKSYPWDKAKNVEVPKEPLFGPSEDVELPEGVGFNSLIGPYSITKQQRSDEPGWKFDANKTRYDLLPADALEQVTRVFTRGAAKYTDRNWEKGMSWGRPFAAAMRHLWAWWRGEKNDPEWGLHHLAHAVCCILFLLAFDMRKHGTDDRPKN